MAKKTRTPPPPRRVQAPKRRDTPPSRATSDQRQRLLLYGVAGSGIAGLVVVVLVVVLVAKGGGGASDSSVAATMRAAGCTFQTYPQQDRHHVPLNYKFHYNSFPPTSGPHYFQWVIWGQYDQPVREIQAIHNLEHGGIIIQYGSKIPASQVAKITAFYRSDPGAMLVAPLPVLGNQVAISAWTKLAKCTTFSEHAAKTFRDAYRYHGPERFPPSVLQPGM